MNSLLSNEKRQIALAFGRAAKHYDSFAHYQQDSGHQLLDLLLSSLGEQRRLYNKIVMDAGCGTGFFSHRLGEEGAQVTGVDLSQGMLEIAKSKNTAVQYVCADMDMLPFSEGSFDVVFSNLAIQWCNNLQATLTELYRVTRPGGIIAFTTLAEGSLQELSQAWLSIDEQSHVNHFLNYQRIEDSCRHWHHQLVVQPDKLYFSDLISLLNSLKGIGATHLKAGRHAGLMTKNRLKQLSCAYPTLSGKFPLTYQTVFGVIYRD